MPKIDSHQHFWKYDPVMHSWIGQDMAVIKKDFLPGDLQLILQQHSFDGCIAVQADQTTTETDFLLSLAVDNAFIKGVVGWVDLRAKNVKEALAYYKQFKILKGFRHILQNEAADFMLQPDFINGIAALKEFNFTYDLLIFPNQLPAAIQLIQQFPEQKFVIDHLAKPPIKSGLINEWKKNIITIAQHENVYCKISGMVTEANVKQWAQEDFIPYLDVVASAFGTKRLLYGSDWPVCLVAADYSNMLAIATTYFTSFSTSEQQDIFGNTAVEFYQL